MSGFREQHVTNQISNAVGSTKSTPFVRALGSFAYLPCQLERLFFHGFREEVSMPLMTLCYNNVRLQTLSFLTHLPQLASDALGSE